MSSKYSKKLKKKEYEKKSFEGVINYRGDTMSRIYISMLMSKAFQELKGRQVKLYLYCRAQHYAEKKKPIPDNPLSFTMNNTKWRDLYKIYNNKNHIYNDMAALIEKGFIRCVECGSTTRKKTIYEFSDKWQRYGTPEFEILPSEMTAAMTNKRNKAKISNWDKYIRRKKEHESSAAPIVEPEPDIKSEKGKCKPKNKKISREESKEN